MRGFCATIVARETLDGDVLREFAQPARSFGRNFMTAMYAGFSGVATNAANLSGTSRPSIYMLTHEYGGSDGGFGLTAGLAAGSAYGIVLGSGDTAFAVAHNNLQATIAHGSSAGQLYRSAMTIGGVVVPAGEQSVQMEISRSFANNSSADITVREVGLIGYSLYRQNYSDAFLFSRDVLGSPMLVAPGRQLDVSIVFRTDL